MIVYGRWDDGHRWSRYDALRKYLGVMLKKSEIEQFFLAWKQQIYRTTKKMPDFRAGLT